MAKLQYPCLYSRFKLQDYLREVEVGIVQDSLSVCVCVCVHACVRTCACVHVCTCACVRACVYVCVWLVLEPSCMYMSAAQLY